MTTEEITSMAADAGFGTLLPAEMAGSTLLPATWVGADQRKLERFAALVAAKEREACAQVCESWDDPRNYAAAIRARGTKEGV